MSFNIEVDGGKSVRLPTGGKYCDRDIVVTATGGDTDAAYQQGLVDGKQAEYNAFWDAYQNNGDRKDCSYMFTGIGWNNTLLNPKHIVRPITATMMFAYSNIDIDVFSHPMFDFSKTTGVTQMFSGSAFTQLGAYTASTRSGLRYMFFDAQNLKSIAKLIVGEASIANYYENAFINCSELVEVRFDGVIAHTGLNFSWSPLSVASMKSIINHLSSTKIGLSVTLSKTAVDKAFETSEGANDGSTSDEWTTLIATKPNWTITLA